MCPTTLGGGYCLHYNKEVAQNPCASDPDPCILWSLSFPGFSHIHRVLSCDPQKGPELGCSFCPSQLPGSIALGQPGAALNGKFLVCKIRRMSSTLPALLLYCGNHGREIHPAFHAVRLYINVSYCSTPRSRLVPELCTKYFY